MNSDEEENTEVSEGEFEETEEDLPTLPPEEA